MKKIIKFAILSLPGANNLANFIYSKREKAKLWLGSYVHDCRTDQKYMGWNRNRENAYWSISSELIFQYHKLEKGLCLPIESRRFFGVDAARETINLLDEWTKHKYDTKNPIYKAAIETLKAWKNRIKNSPNNKNNTDYIFEKIERFSQLSTNDEKYLTPIQYKTSNSSSFREFQELMICRRSVRNFESTIIDFNTIETCVKTAQLSPSACNRQPWHIHFYEDPALIKSMLSLQNGNTGFGHTVPLLAIITTDLYSFFDASERIEPILDGGLFLMSFILALQSLGLSSCCLNWCVLPDKDIKAHEIGKIPPNEKILTFLAIGYPKSETIVPLSARRSLDDVIRRHS